MRSFRFSIAHLLLLIVFLGFSFAALRSPSQLWANAWFSAALVVLTIAVLAAVYRRGRRRAFWVGFASCGWLYLVLAVGPWFGTLVGSFLVTTAALDILASHVAPSSPPAVGMFVLSTPGPTTITAPKALPAGNPPPSGAGGVMGSGTMSAAGMMPGAGLYVVPQQPSAWSSWTEPDRDSGTGAMIGRVRLASSDSFRRIGHSQFALLGALLGGVLTRRLASTREDER